MFDTKSPQKIKTPQKVKKTQKGISGAKINTVVAQHYPNPHILFVHMQ